MTASANWGRTIKRPLDCWPHRKFGVGPLFVQVLPTIGTDQTFAGCPIETIAHTHCVADHDLASIKVKNLPV